MTQWLDRPSESLGGNYVSQGCLPGSMDAVKTTNQSDGFGDVYSGRGFTIGLGFLSVVFRRDHLRCY